MVLACLLMLPPAMAEPADGEAAVGYSSLGVPDEIGVAIPYGDRDRAAVSGVGLAGTASYDFGYFGSALISRI